MEEGLRKQVWSWLGKPGCALRPSSLSKPLFRACYVSDIARALGTYRGRVHSACCHVGYCPAGKALGQRQVVSCSVRGHRCPLHGIAEGMNGMVCPGPEKVTESLLWFLLLPCHPLGTPFQAHQKTGAQLDRVEQTGSCLRATRPHDKLGWAPGWLLPASLVRYELEAERH